MMITRTFFRKESFLSKNNTGRKFLLVVVPSIYLWLSLSSSPTFILQAAKPHQPFSSVDCGFIKFCDTECPNKDMCPKKLFYFFRCFFLLFL